MMLVLMLGSVISFSSCSKDDDEGNNNLTNDNTTIIGTWYCENNSEVGGLCFNADGTGYGFFDNSTKKDEFTYQVANGTITFLSGKHYAGMSWQYSISGNVLVISMNGMSISYTKRSANGDNAAGNKEDNNDNTSSTNDSRAVDLGLSVKWASCNIGASSSEEFGDYFAWGEIEAFQVGTYKFNNGYDGTVLKSSDDVATVKWGANWHVPSVDEMNELITKCTWTSTVVKEVFGYMITGTNGNSIFIPTAGGLYSDGSPSTVGEKGYGYYWTNELLDARTANILKFNSAGCWIREREMQSACPVRAVYH